MRIKQGMNSSIKEKTVQVSETLSLREDLSFCNVRQAEKKRFVIWNMANDAYLSSHMLGIDPEPKELGVAPSSPSHKPFRVSWPLLRVLSSSLRADGSQHDTGSALGGARLAVLRWILSVIMIWRKIVFMGYINNFNWLGRPKCAFFVWLPRLLSRLLIMFRFSFQQKQEIKHPLLEWQLFNKPAFQHPLCNFRPGAS